MLSLLLGPDDYGKTQYMNMLASQRNSEVQVLFGQEDSFKVDDLTQTDMFSGPKVFAVKQAVGLLDSEQILEKLNKSPNVIFFLEKKLDKRSKMGKFLATSDLVEKIDFPLPHGQELNKFILKRIEELKGSIEPGALELLAVRLGRDSFKENKYGPKVEYEEAFDLWSVENEIKKLVKVVPGKTITEEMVKYLVNENREVDAFEITNSLGQGNTKQALILMHEFLSQEATGSDQKTSAIQLNALLSEQFRNIALFQDFLKNKVSESEILEKTGWKSGRVFVMKKLALNFDPKKVLEVLGKLESLDLELKTSTTPPKVILDLIIAGLK